MVNKKSNKTSDKTSRSKDKTIVVKRDGEVITITDPGRYQVKLTQPDIRVTISGVFQTSGNDEVDVALVIHHQAPRTQAETVLKGVADDRSSLSLQGLIVIDEACGQSQSFLTERILLLTDQARAEAIPELEIMTDDVKCSHAASISRIPESQIFYLMSRGLSKEQAQDLVVTGFLDLSNSPARQ